MRPASRSIGRSRRHRRGFAPSSAWTTGSNRNRAEPGDPRFRRGGPFARFVRRTGRVASAYARTGARVRASLRKGARVEGLELTERVEYWRRLEPRRVVRVHVGETDFSPSVDHEGCGNRQLPRPARVPLGEIFRDREKDRLQLLVELEDESVGPGDREVEIGTDAERERVLLRRGERIVRFLGSDRDERGTKGLDVGEPSLVGLQLQVAVRSPAAAVGTSPKRVRD